MKEALEELIHKEVTRLGFELASVAVRGTRSRPVVDVRLDRIDGGAITVDDCARVSRVLEARLDEARTLGEHYVLEVSSAGVERPLRSVSDWRRFAGRQASVVADAVGGRAELEIVGVEGPEGTEVVILRSAAGHMYRVGIPEIRDARLVFHWQR